MNIGFDAKRAYHNHTGLGHYSRSLIGALAALYPQHQYWLFNPKKNGHYAFDEPNVRQVLPVKPLHKALPWAWRSKWMVGQMRGLHLDLYHGLSHEIPQGIENTGIKTVVTIHDLIHERYPHQYKALDVRIYRQKFRHACRHANAIIATSQQTKEDIVALYGVDAHKIWVCYQSCNPMFETPASAHQKASLRERYQLPEQYFLSVGSIIERKNLLLICEAMASLGNKLLIPLVVIGQGTGQYAQRVKQYIAQAGLGHKVLFLNEGGGAGWAKSVHLPSQHLPALYQMATALIYPSVYEGFGIPILEAMHSGLPVIASNASCLPEVGGPAARYVNWQNPDELAAAMLELATQPTLRQQMAVAGLVQAQNFSRQRCAEGVMAVYGQLLPQAEY
ncbi:MAG: glycosyltransferase family 1 protein [Bacteroidetes bacterium]|nr:MAG: glycosyltransferase family 1 protein [Bacteroidota bacterium]